jgi:hypothetical protein
MLSCLSTLHNESIDMFHHGDFSLSRKLSEIWKLVFVGQWQLIVSSWIWSSVPDSAALALSQTDLSSPQQSWMPSRSVGHRPMLPVVQVESTARLPMLARRLARSSAEQPMEFV